jgi:hypothetical protein
VIARKLVSAALLLLLGVIPMLGSPALSGLTWFDAQINSSIFSLDASFGAELVYDFGGVSLASDSVMAWPTTWVWQGISTVGSLGAFAFTTNVLFGPSTAEYLYAEAIIGTSMGGIDLAWHAAQLSDAVFGGPADGWALRVSAITRGFEIVSISEFGARIEDDDFDGITIVHAATGEERHYATDPLVPGKGFTGEKATIRALDLRCADLVGITFYATCAGFQFVAFEASGLETGLPWLALDTELTFELETKDFSLSPTLLLGDVACVQLFADLAWNPAAGLLNAITISGLELACKLGAITVRDVAVLDLHRYVITTEAQGNAVETLVDALDQNHDYYPDYWQMLSIAYDTTSCCDGVLSFLANVFFDEASSSLFDWAMTHVQAAIPLDRSLSFSIEVEALSSDFSRFGFGFAVSW